MILPQVIRLDAMRAILLISLVSFSSVLRLAGGQDTQAAERRMMQKYQQQLELSGKQPEKDAKLQKMYEAMLKSEQQRMQKEESEQKKLQVRQLRLLEESEKNAKRFERLLGVWEKQAKQQEQLLKKQEALLKAQERKLK